MARARIVFASILCAFASAFPSISGAQQAWLGDWAAETQARIRAAGVAVDPVAEFGEPVAIDLARRPARRVDRAEVERNARTVALYAASVGTDSAASLLWTGVETANPLDQRETYRWSSLEDQGLFDPARRERLTSELASLGVSNLRIGLANHEIDLDRPESWARHDAFVGDLAAAGLKLSLDMHHFGVEDRFRATDADGRPDPARSYYLHLDWPAYFARFSGEAYRRYGGLLTAVTLVNEPETTVGFNSQMWHGGHPGWGDPRHERVYVERAFAIARGAVMARIEIEKAAREIGQKPFFMHTEAAVYKPGRADFNRIVRFLPSDLILGHEWLLSADLDRLASAPLEELRKEARVKDPARRGAIQWLLDAYVFRPSGVDGREARREKLVAMIRDLRAEHERLEWETGVSMKDATVFAADYYAHNEASGASGAWLDPEPQLYAAQMAVGERRGLYPLIHDYFDRYRLPMMIGETGTPFYAYGQRWHAQLLLEVASAMADGVPMLGYVIYPLVDTYGWEAAMSVPKALTTVNTGGIMDLSLEARPFMSALIATLNNRAALTAKVNEAEADRVP